MLITIIAIGICFSMTDVFRSEILAVVMQQIMDEQTLPVLFLRTVRIVPKLSVYSILYIVLGDPSSHDIQDISWLCIHNTPLSLDHQKNLDESAPLGRFHPMCQSHRTCELWSLTTAPTRSASGTCR